MTLTDLVRVAAIWLLLPLAGCSPQLRCPDGGCSVGTLTEDPALVAPCPESKPCADYLDFLTRRRRPTDLAAQVPALSAAHEAGASAPAVDTPLQRALAIDDLPTDAPLRVRAVSTAQTAFGSETDLLLLDPEVGRLRLLLLLPKGDGPVPGVVALPGHGDSPAFHRDRYLGADLAAAGFAVLIVGLRNHRGDAVESELTRAALAGGRTVLGLHVYEAQLAARVLRWHPRVHPDRLALMGHSGGAGIALLAAHLDPRYRALVLDHQGAFLSVLPDGRWLADVAPDVHRMQGRLNDLGRLATPSYVDTYEFPKGAEPVAAFLRKHLTAGR